MAKKEKEVVESVSGIKELTNKYGKEAFISGEDFLKEKREVISFSPKLDLLLDGGIPEGSFVILSGPPKCGKTVSSLHFAANAQLLGRKVYYLNIEGRIKPRDLNGIPKLQLTPDKFQVVRSYKTEDGQTKILLAHEYLEIAERLIDTEPGCIIIIDSVSQLCTEDEQTADIDEQKRAPGPVLMARFTKRIANKIPVSKCIVISILHVVANTGGGPAKKSRTGGNKVVYAVDVDLDCTHTERWKVGGSADNEESGTQIGKKVHWIANSTAGNVGAGAKTTSYIRYGYGIDEVYELFDVAKICSLVEKKGSWFNLSFIEGEEVKFQGEEKAIDYLRENPDKIELLKTKVKELL